MLQQSSGINLGRCDCCCKELQCSIFGEAVANAQGPYSTNCTDYLANRDRSGDGFSTVITVNI